MKNKNEKAVGYFMDERQNEITQKAIVFGYIFLVLCMFVKTVYQIVTTGDAGWELFGIVGSAAVILIARRLLGDVEQPLDYKNRPLPTGSSKAERMVRCKSYAFGSVWLGLAFAVGDILLISFGAEDVTDYDLSQIIFPNLSKGATIGITAGIAFASMFLISFVFDYLVGEYFKVRRYNRMMAQLDAEEAMEN